MNYSIVLSVQDLKALKLSWIQSGSQSKFLYSHFLEPEWLYTIKVFFYFNVLSAGPRGSKSVQLHQWDINASEHKT